MLWIITGARINILLIVATCCYIMTVCVRQDSLYIVCKLMCFISDCVISSLLQGEI